MITNEQIRKYLSSLKAHSATVARRNQKYRIPIIIDNHEIKEYPITHDGAYTVDNAMIKKPANIYNTKAYRFNGRWYNYHYSIDNPEETFGILKVDDLFMLNINKVNKKSFIGRIDKLIFQGELEPFMLFIDKKFVNWDYIDLVYDCDDMWLLLRGDKYNYYNLRFAEVTIIMLPFRCEYFGIEPDWLFNLNYNALQDYLQSTSSINEDGKLYIKSPTLDTECIYRGMNFNIGGWLYTQIKRYSLGALSDSRINKLRNIEVTKIVKNNSGDIIESKYTRYNAFDRDVVTNKELYEKLYHMPLNEYNKYPALCFNEDGLFDTNGVCKLRIMNTDILYRSAISDDDKILFNLSEIDNLLFRENYLVFEDGLFEPGYPIMGSINNITFCDNPENKTIAINVLYNKNTDHVIRNSDRFMRNYMNEQARIYLEVLYHTRFTKREAVDAIKEDKIYKNIDIELESTDFAFKPKMTERIVMLTPDGDNTEILKRTLVDAHVLDSTKVIKSIEAFYLDKEFAFVPRVTDYLIYINDIHNDAIELVKKAIEPLDYDFSNDKLYTENIKDAIDYVVDYDPLLLNGLYHTFVDSKVFSGEEANEALLYSFMYENKRGLKIPRKRYNNHETYFMIFLNGELYENYYKTIAYANFFFIPIEDEDFRFAITDRIEVIYFKNVNNNEIKFKVTDRLVSTFEDNEEDLNFYNASVFKPYIRPKELQIFSPYPEKMMHYPTLISEASNDIAFKISYRDSNGNLCIKKDGINTIGTTEADGDELIATSYHKFIYQRLYVEQKSYRIRLDRRFRYCDNQRQYLLFINGRRMKQDSYLITIPKHTRPFNNIYLYTARFIGTEDRVELFYLPYDMTDINNEVNINKSLKSNGYIEYDKDDLKVPMSKDLYLFFVNGKKIPSTDIIDIDSKTVRITINTNSLINPIITAITVDSIPEVSDYLQDNSKISKYDSLVNYIKTHSKDAYAELDKLFGFYTQLSNTEEDKTWANVAKIAILNEIVRDFWVTSGYPYQDQLFVYDYEQDELYEKTDNGTLILPALDAMPEINIRKNDVSLLYFYTNPKDLLFEKGDVATSFNFYWDYSQRLNQPWHIVFQSINGREIPVNDRDYTWEENITETRNFRFEANSGYTRLIKDTELKFVNGIYWGVIDEDSLQYYKRAAKIQYMDEIIAVIPKNGAPLPKTVELEKLSRSERYTTIVKEKNILISGLGYTDSFRYDESLWLDPAADYIDESFMAICDDGRIIRDIFWERYEFSWSNQHLKNIADDDFIAILEDGRILRNLTFFYDPARRLNIRQYYDENDLPNIIKRLDKHLVRTPNILLNDYVIGNNNYFVFACPKNVVYKDYHNQAEFYMPYPYNEDIVAHCRDDKTTPIYTDGTLDKENHLFTKLYKMSMEYMGECSFTNDYGYTEEYMVWKTNGYFTRLFENYGINIRIKIGDFTDAEVIYDNTSKVNVIDYIDGVEVEPIIPDSERTENTVEGNTTTVNTPGNASTLPEDNAASIKKTGAGKIEDNTVTNDSLPKTVELGDESDSARTKELLSQGIFLI